jgi:hypothetical protein
MITSVTALAAKPVPAYCTSGYGVLTPAQWKTCWNLGYNQPVNSTVAHVGFAAGKGAVPAVLLIVIVLAVIALSRRRSGRPATN